MKHSSKVMAVVMAGAMLLPAVTPVAAMADPDPTPAKQATGSTPVTVVKENVAYDDEDAKNLEVIIPTSIPLAATGDDNALVGPTTAGFTNRSAKAVELTDIGAQTLNGFEASSATAKNHVELKVTRATNSKQYFTLANAVNETDADRKTAHASTLKDDGKGWVLPAASEDPDLIVVDSSSKISNLTIDLSTKKQFATLNWTFTEVTE